MIDHQGLSVCKSCKRLTANGCGVCTKCLNGEKSKPRGGRSTSDKDRRRKYTDEEISRVIHTYLGIKALGHRGPVEETARLLGMKTSSVQFMITYYKSTLDPQNEPTNMASAGPAG